MTFWSGEKVLERCPDLISDFDQVRIDCNGYRLRMGGEYYCTSDARQPTWGSTRRESLAANEAFTIAPGQFGFLLSKEAVKVPADAMAFISIRTTAKFRGLINISGFHVDPGYEGKLVFAVFNAGPSNIHVSEGEELFLIWFASLDVTSRRIRKKDGYTSIPSSLINGMNREIVSLSSLASEISSIKINLRVQAIVFGIAVTFFFAVLAAAANLVFKDRIEQALGISSTPPATSSVNPSPAAPPIDAPITAPSKTNESAPTTPPTSPSK